MFTREFTVIGWSGSKLMRIGVDLRSIFPILSGV